MFRFNPYHQSILATYLIHMISNTYIPLIGVKVGAQFKMQNIEYHQT